MVVVQCSIHNNHMPILYVLITSILDKRQLVLLSATLIFISFDWTFRDLYNDIKIYGKKHWPTQSILTILASGTRFYTFLLLRGSFSLEMLRFCLRPNVILWISLKIWIDWYRFHEVLWKFIFVEKFALVPLRVLWKNESHRNTIF